MGNIYNVKRALESLSNGQLIELQTRMQKLVGRLHYVDEFYDFIVLDVLQDAASKRKCDFRQLISMESINAFQVLKSIEDSSCELSETSSFCSCNSTQAPNQTNETDESINNVVNKLETSLLAEDLNLTTSSYDTAPDIVEEVNHPLPTTTLSSFETHSIRKRIDNPIVIHQNDAAYDKALADMMAQQVIALHIEKNNCKTSIIAVATVKMAYIFDMISLGHIYDDFKYILECETPRKAVHGCHLIDNHLKNQHNVQIKGTFDTFAAYCIVTKKKCHINFVDIIEQYVGIDEHFFHACEATYSYDTLKRPIGLEHLKVCAKRVVLVLKLQEHLQNQMLSKFYSQCKEFSRTFEDCKNIVVVTRIMQTNKSAGFESITGLDLRDQSI